MKHVETNPDGRVLTLTPEGARQVAADWAAATRPPGTGRPCSAPSPPPLAVIPPPVIRTEERRTTDPVRSIGSATPIRLSG